MAKSQEGVTKYYRTQAAAERAHARVIDRYGYSTVWRVRDGLWALHITGARKNPSGGVRTAPKSAIPSKFVSAKVRRVGGKVQILLNN